MLSSDTMHYLGDPEVALTVAEQASTPRLRVQSSTEAGLHSFQVLA